MKNILEQFKGLKVLIVGDVMFYAYYFGKVDRISPEAPVPVVAVE
jgi:D-beta-D-heptose 7-phosphate kinase/D-beta-D-heptose 1-phosphate adenosyltransferase